MSRKSIPGLVAVFLLLAASTVIWAQKSASPVGVTNNFYRKYIAYQMRGLPTEKQTSGLAPLLSPEIISFIAADRAQQNTFIKEHSDEKPPWIEGDLFSSLFEGATSYTVGRSRVTKSRAEVDVHLVYKHKSDTTEWMDTVILTRLGSRWVISDILYKGNWAFQNGASLRAALTN